ncbi:hypothetical protein AB837_00507 [bacterium AB1]|nr:hypothetical protein AB837_00507 [bacterium AB1]
MLYDLICILSENHDQDKEQLRSDLTKSFRVVEDTLHKMYHVNGRLLLTQDEIFLDDISVANLFINSDNFYFCQYALSSLRFKEYYTHKKDSHDLSVLDSFDSELDTLNSILKQSTSINIEQLKLYCPKFCSNVRTCVNNHKREAQHMIEDIAKLQICDTKSSLFFKQSKIVMKQLNKFQKKISSLQSFIIDKFDYCLVTYEIIGPMHYTSFTKTDELKHHIQMYENYLLFVKQVYNLLDYLNNDAGKLTLERSDSQSFKLFLDSVFLILINHVIKNKY